MADRDKRQMLDDLRREVGRICDGQGAWQDISKPRDFRSYEPAPPDARLREMGRTTSPAERRPFGRWLMQQEGRGGLVATLARAARTDPGFPLDGDAEAVRKRLRACMADGDMFEAVDEAELDWASW
jgi:hypothetical protein